MQWGEQSLRPGQPLKKVPRPESGSCAVMPDSKILLPSGPFFRFCLPQSYQARASPYRES